MRPWLLVALVGCGRFGFANEDAGQADDDTMADAVPVDPALIVWYRMDDDPADGSLEDSAGGDHRAFCAAGLTCGTSVPGVRGDAVGFQPQQFYRLPYEAQLDMPTSFTVAFWVNAAAVAPVMLVTKRYDLIYNSWGIRLTALNEVRFETARTGPIGENFTSVQTVSVGVWTHVAVTWDDTTRRIHINGVRFREDMPLDVTFDAGEVLLGCDEDNQTRLAFFAGALDDVRIYSRALSETELGLLAQP